MKCVLIPENEMSYLCIPLAHSSSGILWLLMITVSPLLSLYVFVLWCATWFYSCNGIIYTYNFLFVINVSLRRYHFLWR